MTPKEKAKQLVNEFSAVGLQQRNEGITCALIAVDEILRVHRSIEDYVFIKTAYTITFDTYWYEVKQ